MAWAEKLPKGGFRGCYRDGAGKRRSSSTDDTGRPFVRETQARAWAAAQEQDTRRTGRDPDAGRMKWSAWAPEWESARRIEASTARSATTYMRHVHDRWDDVRLIDITPQALRRWVRDLEKVYAPLSVRKVFYLLSASLRVAVGEGYLIANPCTGVELPPPPPMEERYLTEAEVAGIFYRLDGRYRLLGEILLGTGLRLSEACGLHWHRVDLDRGVVHVIETWDKAAHEMKAYPKGQKRRTVPMTDGLVELIERWRDQHPDAGTCERIHGRYRAARSRELARGVDPHDRCRSGLVVPGPQGAPIDPKNFGRRQWAQACAPVVPDEGDTDTVPWEGVEGAGPHSLRHTYASRLLTRGVSMKRLQVLLGHASMSTTERYAHLQDDGYDEVRAALGGVVERGADDGADDRPAVATHDQRRGRLQSV